MKRAGWLLAAAFAFVSAEMGCSGSSMSQNPSPHSSPPPAARQASTEPADDRPAPDILTVLSVEHELDLLAQRDGVVVEILKDEGTLVNQGGLLCRLDDRALSAQLDKAKASLLVAQNNVRYIEAELKSKRANLRRQQQLRSYGLSSDADLEAAEFQVKGSEYDLDSLRAVVERNQAEIRETQLELDKTSIRAPFSGVVVRRYVRQGQNVVKDDKCFRVSQLSPLRVQFQVLETSERKPRIGDEVNLTLVSDSHRVVARITKISPTVDAASGSYDVTAQLVGSNLSELRPGMAARVIWPGTSPSPKR